MGSLYLSRQSKEERARLVETLWSQQNGKCFISGREIDLAIDEVDVDHIIPTRDSGKDDPSNFALTLQHYNRSKQASNLRVARVLAKLDEIRANGTSDDRGANLNDVLKAFGGSSEKLSAKIDDDDLLTYRIGADKFSTNVHTDKLSGMRYFFAVLPIATIYHDEKINPRAIGSNIRGLIEEFHKKRPQLHVALGWLKSAELPSAEVYLFDGQHKAAAQILLGAKKLPVRVFLDPDFDVLLQANTNAGTTLRQVAFDKSVQRRLGSAMLRDRMTRYRKEKGLDEDSLNFSEKDLVEFFKGEQRQVARYVLDGVRDAITHAKENRLRDYIELAGKAAERPFSYSAIEKTFYSKFIGPTMLETPWNFKADIDENPRDIEVRQILRLMNVIAERVYLDKFDLEIGAARIESRIQRGDDIPHEHLRAYRMAKEEIMHCWLSHIGKVIELYFLNNGLNRDSRKLFQYSFPDQLWQNIENFVENLANHAMWVDREASATVFGGKQTYAFWQEIFETGSSPQGQRVMASGLNILEMIKK